MIMQDDMTAPVADGEEKEKEEGMGTEEEAPPTE